MSVFNKAAIGLALVLALAVAWVFFAPPRQDAPSPDKRPIADSPKRPTAAIDSQAEPASKSVEPAVAVADESADPQSSVKTDDVAGDKPAADPVDLTSHYRLKSSDFDKVTQFPWPAVPRGSQTFAGVPLEIGGAIFLWGERNEKAGMKYPEQVAGIPLKRKFETLYVCHASFYEGPAGIPLCEVVFHYDDGTSATDAILCGDDARDWFVKPAPAMLGPTGPRSTLAWKGEGKMGERTQPIRFCLTAIANPHPDQEVIALDLNSAKTQAAACILAISTGKADLMKRTEDLPPSEDK